MGWHLERVQQRRLSMYGQAAARNNRFAALIGASVSMRTSISHADADKEQGARKQGSKENLF